MSNQLVYLNLDRNGNVSSIQPEAVVVGAGDSVTYQLREPSSTNWVFLGVQFSECANDFAGVNIDRSQLTLREHSKGSDGDVVEVTLLYVLAESQFYKAGDDPSKPAPNKLKKQSSLRAFDPMIIREN